MPSDMSVVWYPFMCAKAHKKGYLLCPKRLNIEFDLRRPGID